MAHPTKVTYCDRTGTKAASIVTTRHDAKFALIGNFKGEGYRVISLHRRLDLANPADVHNSDYTDVTIAEQI